MIMMVQTHCSSKIMELNKKLKHFPSEACKTELINVIYDHPLSGMARPSVLWEEDQLPV
ncbi:hypothetical protein IHE45_04G169200 [Dioscorea alata]|uniref:Uncharacterized protein n=1 Tax=Dioscorea alata TaxID=55571 RepID=A0ACB7WHU5_DIOAL|nr:hypothetical protein IHE45_04G169200 [Dioscorea alata]